MAVVEALLPDIGSIVLPSAPGNPSLRKNKPYKKRGVFGTCSEDPPLFAFVNSCEAKQRLLPLSAAVHYFTTAAESQATVSQAAVSTATLSTTTVSDISTTAVESAFSEVAALLPQAAKPAAIAATHANWKSFFIAVCFELLLKTAAKIYLFPQFDTQSRFFYKI